MAILKFSKGHFIPNRRSDWAKTWWEASERHRDSELLKLLFFFFFFFFDIQEFLLKFFKRHLLPNRNLDRAETWWEASERHRDSDLLKSVRLAIQDGRLGSHLETTSAPEPKSDWAKTRWKALWPHGDFELRFDIQDGRMSAILKIFKQYLLRSSWKSDGAETWWKASGQHGDLEFLKWFRSDIQDGHHGSHLENLKITSATERLVWLSLINFIWGASTYPCINYYWPPLMRGWGGGEIWRYLHNRVVDTVHYRMLLSVGRFKFKFCGLATDCIGHESMITSPQFPLCGRL